MSTKIYWRKLMPEFVYTTIIYIIIFVVMCFCYDKKTCTIEVIAWLIGTIWFINIVFYLINFTKFKK
jgi:glycerol uptake facilitator-like aquaporin